MDRTHATPWWSLTLAAAALGCGPTGGFSLETGDDETGSGDGDSGDGDSGDSGEPDGIAPELLSASTDKTGSFVLLRFSEPMAPPTGVDPSDFRLSYGFSLADAYLSPSSTYSLYYDPHVYFVYEPPYPSSELLSVSAGQAATDLILRFAEPLPPNACTSIELMRANIEEAKQTMPGFDARVGLFPHYSPGATPVRSAQGEALAAIGPEWVETDAIYTEVNAFGFPNLVPQIPINCLVEP